MIARLIDGTPKVIATGGGAFINDETRALILDQAIAIWLDAEPDVLVERVAPPRHAPAAARPRSARGARPNWRAVRNPIYALAPIRVASAPGAARRDRRRDPEGARPMTTVPVALGDAQL